MNRIRFIGLTVAFVLAATPALADGSAVLGEKVFAKCRACHAVGDGAKDKVGPQLNNMFGRTAGTLESYAKKYSKAMIEAGENGLVWNEDSLEEYLVSPRTMIKGTKMTFAGLKKEDDIEDVIAYLIMFSPDYSPAE